MNREPPVTPGNAALVRETKKIKRLGSSFTALSTSLNCVLAELNQTSFVFVELEAKLRKPRVELFQTRSRFVTVLKTDHKVICVANHHHVAAALFTPPLNPQVKDVVQLYVGKQR